MNSATGFVQIWQNCAHLFSFGKCKADKKASVTKETLRCVLPFRKRQKQWNLWVPAPRVNIGERRGDNSGEAVLMAMY